MTGPLHLAAYGFVAADAGSLASANDVVLAELLARGHRIDFYAIDGFIHPGRLADRPNLTFLPVRDRLTASLWPPVERLPAALRRAAATVLSQVSNRRHYAGIERVLLARHARQKYDALLALGLLSPWRLPGGRTVSWTQGTPRGEFGWATANAISLTRRAGPLLLPGLAAVYAPKYIEAFADHRKADVVIAGSRWAVESWRRFGVPRRKLTALPYPVDLAAFQPENSGLTPAARLEINLLHLGRVVPRKRLDLLLAGFARFRRTEPAAALKIVGGLSYGTRGDRALLAANPPSVEYRERVPRADVPGLLAWADCVVQPSENENFGSAVAESLAAGRPVLVGPTNGTADYIGAASVVFAEYTPEAVAAGMAEIARRVRADRAAVTADCRAAAERHFAVAAVVDRLEALLRGERPA